MTNGEVLEKMLQDMKMRNFSHYTYEFYIGKTKEMMRYFNKPIEEVSNIVSEEQETKKDTTNKKFEISVGPKTFVIAGGALIGIALGLGGAVAISKNKNKNKHHRTKKENVEITPPKYTDSLDEFGFFDTNGNISPVNESKEQTPQQGIVDDPFDFFRDTTSEKRENNPKNQSPRRH